jgi:acyl-CoA dehydrogenase
MSGAGFGLLSENLFLSLSLIGLGALIVGFNGAPFIVWGVLVLGSAWGFGAPSFVLGLLAAVVAIGSIRPLRAQLVSRPVMKLLKAMKLMPAISETEKIALEAGSTWVDGELFSGKPNFDRIRNEKMPSLSAEEQKFLNGPVEQLCSMVTDWEIFTHHDLPDRVWAYLKKERFFGMIVPKEYGGHGFSAICHSEVVQKLTSRSVPLAVTVMVPNSLGPAELILHYGTDAQKNYYLPRLARGEEIPCFALTESGAGSDAGSMTSSGEIFKAADGKIYMKLNWEKRYITLAAVSSLIGLAVKLRDPSNLLGKGTDLGITCVLVPANTSGVVLGKRHNPMGVPFYNCPTSGHEVVLSIDQIIGGAAGAGNGWRMLMECLAAGRAISLPAQSLGTAKLTARAASAYSAIREQFGVSINKFEGVEERLARVVGLTYLMDSTRRFTAGAVDSGLKPAVISAIAKCYMTELSRTVINDGMDILGGAGISRGPRNLLANPYIGIPIGITVEGANILTRSMIIFGQGAIRCHPFAYREFQAVESGNVHEFDSAFWGHIGFVVRNFCRSSLLSVTRGRLAAAPFGKTRRYYQKLAWSSASFALMSDMAMGTLAGSLKFKEKLTGRYADALAWMYLATATLRRFEADGSKAEHLPYLHWSMNYCFAEIQKAFDGIFRNFDVPVIGTILRWPIAFWSSLNRFAHEPSDRQAHALIRSVVQPTAFRNDLTAGIFVPHSGDDVLRLYEGAFEAIHEASVAYKKVRAAIASKKLPKKLAPKVAVKMALDQGIITKDEANIIDQAAALRTKAIQVDSFKLDDFQTGHLESSQRKTG